MSMKIMAGQFPKRCDCGAVHTEAGWAGLEHVGLQMAPPDDGEPALAISLRNCACGSTLAVEVDP